MVSLIAASIFKRPKSLEALTSVSSITAMPRVCKRLALLVQQVFTIYTAFVDIYSNILLPLLSAASLIYTAFVDIYSNILKIDYGRK